MNDRSPAPLEGTPREREAWLAAAAAFVREQLDSLEDAPAQGLVGAEANRRARELSPPIAEAPLEGGLEGALAILRQAIPLSLNAAGPGYLAYIPGGGLPLAAIAELIAGATNRYTGTAAPAPALCRLEADVLAWLAREFGYGPDARGLLTSGGSIANLTAIVTARVHAFGDDGDYRRAIAYTSSQAHHSVAKALRLAGIPAANLRLVEVDEALELRPAALRAAIAADRQAGARPFLVIAAAGTTNTGAVDPLPELAAICRAEGLWLHVDGAYGGAFALSPRARARLAGIDRADSITFDPHKGMFLPYGTGCLLVADGQRLARAHAGGGDYLQDLASLEDEGEAPSPSAYGPELSRSFRGLRLWLPLIVHGAAAFRDALDEKIELAAAIEAGLRARIAAGAPLEIPTPTRLSVVAFRLRRRPGEAADAWDRRNLALLAGINRRQSVHLSSTRLPIPGGSITTLRACVLSFRTHRPRIDRLLADLDAALAD
ncbi:MAG: aminotransferase class V-fold PLP-dependent enzyme [Myxococcales bacterium]|nr:aminotransferase class V-fold PLP-dependent enzyme [Myxococcales bacterium]